MVGKLDIVDQDNSIVYYIMVCTYVLVYLYLCVRLGLNVALKKIKLGHTEAGKAKSGGKTTKTQPT